MSATQQSPPQEQPTRDEGFEWLKREQHDPDRVAHRESASRRPN
jgi:hypothetical protein